MSKVYSAGIATAYGAAVRGGYTGTYEQWCALMADYATVGEGAAASASDAANSATTAESWAVGGTSTRTGEDTNNASFYAGQSASYVSEAEAHATTAESWAVGDTASRAGENTNNAMYYATQADASATEAESWAVGGTESRTGEDTNNASYYATQASTSAGSASTSATEAESWAVGGTSSRTGEDTNNACYYATQAGNSATAAAASAESAAQSDYDATVLAPAYDVTKTYAVGDYVTRTGKLYRCVSAIETAEAWTAAHWSEVAVGADISDIKSAINTRNVSLSNVVANYVVSSQTGKVTASNAYSYIEFSVLPGSTLLFATGHNENATGIAFYDNNGTFVSGIVGANGEQTVTVPQTALSAKACYRTSEVSSFYVKQPEYTEPLISHINTAEHDASALKKVLITERYLTSTWVHGSINSSGADAGNANYVRSDFIEIPPNVAKYIRVTLQKGNYSDNLSCSIYVYNAANAESYANVLVGLAIGERDITNYLSEGQYVRCRISDGSTQIDISDIPDIFSIMYDTIDTDKTLSLPNYPADAQAVGEALKRTDYSYAMTRVLCIGDSLTRGSSPSEAWGVSTGTVPIYQNYPYMLGRMVNCEVENAGFSGISASTWYQNWADTVTPVADKPYKVPCYDFASYDTFIIWLGTNNGFDPDDLDTEGTEANYYCKIIEAIQTGYAAGHTDSRYSDHGQIILVKVFATKSGYNLADTNAAIDAIATKYSLPVIDNSDLSPSEHPELHENVENPHFGKSGYIFIANRFCKEISEWISQNPTRADFGETQAAFGGQ